MLTVLTFTFFTFFVAIYTWYKLKNQNLSSQDGYFLGGRSLTGIVIAGSMLLTNISTEHLIGMNGSSYKNGFIIIAWEVTSSLALIFAALYFVPKYLKMGLVRTSYEVFKGEGELVLYCEHLHSVKYKEPDNFKDKAEVKK